MQADLVHQLVHEEGASGHVSAVFEERESKEENENVGQKDDDAAHAADDAVDDKAFESVHRPVRPVRLYSF